MVCCAVSPEYGPLTRTLYINPFALRMAPGRVAQSAGHQTCKSEVLGPLPGLATYFRFCFTDSTGAVVSYWRKYVHEVLVNRLGDSSLPRKRVVSLTDHPNMTIDVYRGHKTTTQQLRMAKTLWCFGHSEHNMVKGT